MAACGKTVIGYSSREVTGEFLLNRLKTCYLEQGGTLAADEMPDVSGVGISFGADRIYDVMTQLELFPDEAITSTKSYNFV